MLFRSAHYGLNSQLDKLIEEPAEVIQAIQKYKQNKNLTTGLIEELADLSVVHDQVVYLLDCNKRIDAVRQYKVMREVRRIRLEDIHSRKDNRYIGLHGKI